MLIRFSLVQLGIVFIVSGFISACNAGAINEHKKVINKNILGKKIYSLYDSFNFQKIEVDNEYADLGKGEKYWLAVDSNFEFLTLRTMNEIVAEVFIRNPDLITKRGVSVGTSLGEFNKLYPDAIVLSSYQNGVKRQMLAYCIESAKLEVEIFKDKVFSIRVLDKCK
jgi:hypothetical protein